MPATNEQLKEAMTQTTEPPTDENTNATMRAILLGPSEADTQWARTTGLIAAFHNLATHEPKMAATALGKAYEAAKAWSRLVEPKGED